MRNWTHDYQNFSCVRVIEQVLLTVLSYDV